MRRKAWRDGKAPFHLPKRDIFLSFTVRACRTVDFYIYLPIRHSLNITMLSKNSENPKRRKKTCNLSYRVRSIQALIAVKVVYTEPARFRCCQIIRSYFGGIKLLCPLYGCYPAGNNIVALERDASRNNWALRGNHPTVVSIANAF